MHALGRRVGFRGSVLLFFGVLDVAVWLSLTFPEAATHSVPFYALVSEWLPLWTWGLPWGVAGVLCLVDAFRQHDAAGFAAAIGIKALWGLLFLTAWVLEDLDRGWVGAAIWLLFAAVVARISAWPEPPTGWKEMPWTGQSSSDQE